MNEMERFLAKVERRPFLCWKWRGTRLAAGYGQFQTSGRSDGSGGRIGRFTWLAHRYMYRLVFGDIPPGLQVHHACDNPGCVNPLHLSLGDQRQNIADCKRRGRLAVGERQGSSKLTKQQAMAIRADMRVGYLIAAEYGVSKTVVNGIRAGRGWRWLPD